MEKKRDFEVRELAKTPIVITTCNGRGDPRLKKLKFTRVIIDEAAQATEVEALACLLKAQQVVMIGDHK